MQAYELLGVDTSMLPSETDTARFELGVDYLVERDRAQKDRTVAEAQSVMTVADLERVYSIMSQGDIPLVKDPKEVVDKGSPQKTAKRLIEAMNVWRVHGGSPLDFSYADLRGTQLQGAYLVHARLRNADLRNADLRGADLHEADMRKVDLTGADLTGANLNGACLTRAKVTLPQCSPIPAIEPEYLIGILLEHVRSRLYNQSIWGRECGTPCCLAGRAGQEVEGGDSGRGILLVKHLLPEFEEDVFFQGCEDIAIAELKRVAGIYGVQA